jgi:hypothetical protein
MAIEQLVFSDEPSPGEPPVTVDDLTDAHMGERVYDEHSKTNLDKIAGIVGIKVGQAQKALVLESSRSKTVDKGGGAAETWGVSVRLAVATSNWQVDATVTVPVVAAAVELGFATASAAIDVQGYTGDLSALLPRPASLDVTTYNLYISSFGNIQQRVFSHLKQHGKPELLARTTPTANGN